MTPEFDQSIETARRLWSDEAHQRRRSFGALQQSILADFVRRGLAHSGLVSEGLINAARQELRERGLIAIGILERVLSGISEPFDENERGRTTEALRLWLSGQADELAQSVSRAMPGMSRPEFGQLELHLVEGRVNAEVDRIFVSHDNSVRKAAALTVNAHTIGAVQTGVGASAIVNQSISEVSREELRAAVDALAVAVGKLGDDVKTAARGEMMTIALELKAEMSCDQPRRLELLKYASGLGVAVQSIASLQPAWTLIKTALLAFGISLP